MRTLTDSCPGCIEQAYTDSPERVEQDACCRKTMVAGAPAHKTHTGHRRYQPAGKEHREDFAPDQPFQYWVPTEIRIYERGPDKNKDDAVD